MKLDSLYAIQKKADLQREDKYREIIRQKYAKTKILRVSDSDKYWRAFNGLEDTETVKLVLDTLRFFSDATIRIMDDCKCFTEPLSYDMQARYFLSSKKLPSDKIATVPIGDNTVLIMFAFSRSDFSSQYCCYIQPYTLLSEETRKVTTPTKARDWFIYAVNCLAFTNMATTTFVNIDDDEKLEAARKRVDSGDFELPLQELAFLNYKVYPWEKTHMFFPIFDRVRKTTKGYNRDLTCGCNKMPEIVLPAVDLNNLEDKLYNFFVYQMRTQKLVGADTETTGLNVFFAKIVSLGLTFNLKMGYYLSFRHTRPKRQMLSMQSLSFIRFFAKNGCKGTFEVNNAYKYYDYIDKENDKNLSIDTAKAICNRMKSMQSIWHNAKYDYSMLYEDFGIDLPIFMDTMLAHYVARPGYNANREKSGLKIIAPEELEVESWKIDVTKVQDDFKDIEAAYNARDCCYMYGIALALGDELLKPSVWDLFEIEMKYLPVLICAELSGVRLDAVKLKEIEADLVTKRDKVINHITGLFSTAVDEHFNQLVDEPTVFGKPFLKDKIYLQYKQDPSKANKKALLDNMKQHFNINSNQLMKFFFFKMMGVIPPRKCPVCGSRNFENRDFCNNPSCKNYNVEKSVPYEFVSKVTGEPSFDKHVKEKLSEAGNSLMKELDEYAAANKLITSYCNMDALINPLTGNIHPSYNQARTATGRLSSSRPNFLYTHWKL